MSDSSGNTAGFRDIDQSGSPDYTYDDYGNMKTERNKSITSITYNHLNLPVSVTISGSTVAANNGTISYLYNAAGQKLKKTVTPNGGTAVVTDYLDGYQYHGGVLEFFPVSDGYVKTTMVSGARKYNYVFQYRDHLGNNRISYTVDPADNVLKILEEDHYYPFGLKHEGYSANQQIITRGGGSNPVVVIVPVINAGDAVYKYMYQGQELQNELGLGWYSFKWRNYNPEIGRFFNIDPLAEEYEDYTQYQFSSNQVVHANEIEGLENENDLNKSLVKNDAIPKQEQNIRTSQGPFKQKDELLINFKDIFPERSIEPQGGYVGEGLDFLVAEGLKWVGNQFADDVSDGQVATFQISLNVLIIVSSKGKNIGAVGEIVEDVAKLEGKAIKSAGRSGKQAKLRELADDPKVSSANRGWIKQEMNSIKRGSMRKGQDGVLRPQKNIRNPPGKDLAHPYKKPAKNGNSYKDAKLKNTADHKTEHKIHGYK